MKLAITQSHLTLKGGAERVVLEIAKRYKAPVYVAEYDPKNTFEGYDNIDVRVISKKVNGIVPYGRISQGISYGLAFSGLILDDEYDVINAHMAPSHWVSMKNPNVIWYCHTPLRDVYDLYDYRMSLRKWHTRPAYALGLGIVRHMDQAAVGRTKSIVANSKNVRSRIEKYYGRRDAKVINPGIDYKKYRNRGDDKFFFYPSRFSPNKRQEMAIEAFRRFKAHVKGYMLVLAGPVSKDKFYNDYYNSVRKEAEEVGSVKILNDVDDATLFDLYSRCTAVLYPPMNEDFGIVPLEAMASSKPVIAMSEGGPKETVDGSGMLVKDTDGMAAAMKLIIDNPDIPEEMGRAGRKRVVERYSWAAFFRKFDMVLKNASDM